MMAGRDAHRGALPWRARREHWQYSACLAMGLVALLVLLPPLYRTAAGMRGSGGPAGPLVPAPTPAPLVRRVPVPGHPVAIAIDARTQRVFALSQGTAHGAYGTVTVLNALTGALVRTTRVGNAQAAQASTQAVAVDASRGQVFVADLGGATLHVLDATSGATVRTLAVPAHPSALALDPHTQHLFVVDDDGRAVSTVDARAGRLLRTVAVGQSADMLAVAASSGRVFVTMYRCVDCSGAYSVLDARTGARRSTVSLFVQEAPGLPVCAVTVDDRAHRGLVYSEPDPTDGKVSIVDGTTGAIMRSVAIGPVSCHAQSVAVDEHTGHAFVFSASNTDAPIAGSVLMLDTRTGRLVHTAIVVKTPVPTLGVVEGALAVDEHHGLLYAVTGSQATSFPPAPLIVTTLETRSGRILRIARLVKHSAAPFVGSAVVDQHTGQLYIADYDDNAVIMFDPQLPTHTSSP